MFLASSPKPIDTQLRELVEQIEKQNTAGVSVLAARQFRYKIYQTLLEVSFTEPRKLNVLEEFILRAGMEFSPPPTQRELATVLGLDPVFVQDTTAKLEELQTLKVAENGLITLTPQGRKFYEQGSVPLPPQAKQIYAIADPLSDNLIVVSSPFNQTRVDLPDLNDFIAIEDRVSDNFSCTLEEVQQLVQASGLGLHVPEDGKNLSYFRVEGETQIIWQTISVFVIFDAIENKVKLQLRRGKKVLEDASDWLDRLLAEGKVSLKDLCQLSDEAILADRNEEVEARIEKIEHQAIAAVREIKASGNKKELQKSEVILLPDNQIRKAFLDTLNSAQQNILIFSPLVREEVIDDEFINIIQNLAKNGVWTAIAYGIASPKVEEKLAKVKTPEGLPAVQIFCLSDSQIEEIVVDGKVYLCGDRNWLSYRGDRLPINETIYKVTTPELVREAYESLANRFKKHTDKLWENAVNSHDDKLAVLPICAWGVLGMEGEALSQLQQDNWLELWLNMVVQGIRSDRVSPDSDCLKTALSLLSETSSEDPNIESWREGWEKIVGAIATTNREAALNLLTEEIWSQFTRLGIVQPPIDSPDKFIAKYAVDQKQPEKSVKNKSKTAVSKKKGGRKI